MIITYRDACPEDCPAIAGLDRIAAGGVLDFLYRDLVPGMSPVELAAEILSHDDESYSFRNARVAETGGEVAGMLISYHSSHHALSDTITDYFPRDRIDHIRVLFTAKVPESLYIDSLAVHAPWRRHGIGGELLAHAARKARGMGLDTLSLITFADNKIAHRLYGKYGFKLVQQLPLHPHELIPHRGGIYVMAAPAGMKGRT
ncbi:MAG TPA: GNAT family N-acetyltransferase [Spirochaetota bacterium]|nr:GNAT family N-acetyltransferase [Spirochaetota bacterium]HOD15255.1 GNAT family N-acetyltransferase [Spirochaetota bacterium]HPG51035.1 GNAT family N-acetyltransferase [Spirochaetota bacterium]HPN11999.1 GNAT family N-acetyltransferase [Spirochaetota bacterium]